MVSTKIIFIVDFKSSRGLAELERVLNSGFVEAMVIAKRVLELK